MFTTALMLRETAADFSRDSTASSMPDFFQAETTHGKALLGSLAAVSEINTRASQ